MSSAKPYSEKKEQSQSTDNMTPRASETRGHKNNPTSNNPTASDGHRGTQLHQPAVAIRPADINNERNDIDAMIRSLELLLQQHLSARACHLLVRNYPSERSLSDRLAYAYQRKSDTIVAGSITTVSISASFIATGSITTDSIAAISITTGFIVFAVPVAIYCG